jgi:hypothetical protein
LRETECYVADFVACLALAFAVITAAEFARYVLALAFAIHFAAEFADINRFAADCDLQDCCVARYECE